MIEQTHNQVPQEPTTDSTVAASLRTLTLCLDQLFNRESEEAITYDGDEPAAHFSSQLESQPNFHNLEPARQARKALSSLRGEPRKIAQDLALLNKTYEEVKESLCAVYPRRPSFTLQEFYELKCTSMAEIETYYNNKVRIGLAINFPKSAIVQALSNGVPRNYGNLLKMAQPSGPEEWLCLAQQLTYEGDNTSTKAAQQRSPRQSRAPSTTVVKTPPYPCRYCGGQHWHAQCQQRGPYQRTFRTFTPAVHSVEQPQRSTGPAGQIKDHQGELRRDTRYILNDKDLMTITRRGVTKIIVPPSLRGTLLQRAHRDFNHPGISQMTRLIAAQYYWDGMTNDIRTHVRTCSVCQLVKPPKGPIYGELGQLPPEVLPFELVSLDTISGFAKYGNSQTFLHVVVDHATRYAWAFPSRSTSILTYTQVIKKVMQFGSPKRLLTDRAPAFTTPKFRRFLIRHNIGQLLTTSNNPQANGLSERLNATITGKLKLLRLQQPKTAWTKLLPQVLQAYNHTPHSVTGFPPSYLLLGSLPLQLSEHVQNYPKIDDARELAYQRTHERHLRDKARFDQTHRASDFEVGDLVLAKTYHHPDTGKLAPFFSGPYEILEIISPRIVRINRSNRPLSRETDTIHVNKLKHYTENEQFISPPSTGPRRASPSSPTDVPPVTAPELPRQASAASPAPSPPDPAMEVFGVIPAAPAAPHQPAVPGQPPPAPMALPMDVSTPAPAPPAPSREKPNNDLTAHTAPQPAEPTPPTPHREESTPDFICGITMATPGPAVASSTSSLTSFADQKSQFTSSLSQPQTVKSTQAREPHANITSQRTIFSQEELKKFDQDRKATYQNRSSTTKSTIQFVSLPDCTAEEHLDGIADVIGRPSIHSIGKINGQAIVSLAGIEQAEMLINTGFKVKNQTIYPYPLFNIPKKYILSGVMLFIQDEDIAKALRPYGHVLSVRPLPFPTNNPLYKHLSSLRREIVIKKKKETSMPAIITIDYMGNSFKIFVAEDVVCMGCKRHGHFRAKCPFDPQIRETTGAETEEFDEDTSARCSQWSMDSSQLQTELKDCEHRDNPKMERIIALVFKRAAPRPSPPVAPGVSMEMAPPAPPPVTPTQSLRAPGSHVPAALTPDIEMSNIEETSASSTSSTTKSTRDGLIAFIERNPGVSFARTDALGLGREEVLDLLSSKTRAKKQGPLLSPTQGDALAGLIGQLLALRPGESSNIYKVLRQKKASEEISKNQNHANSPAGVKHVNLAAERDVMAPTNAASSSANSANPASRSWGDTEMAEVESNDGYTLATRNKKRRLGSPSSEHASRQPNKPGEQRGSQQHKRPTGPRKVPPQDIKATRKNIAEAKARQNSTTHENYIFVELCPEITDYTYLQAMSKLVEAKLHHTIQQNERPLHRRPREQGPCEPSGRGRPGDRGNVPQGLPLPKDGRANSRGQSARLCGGHHRREGPEPIRESHLHRPHPGQNGGVHLHRRPPGGLHPARRRHQTGQAAHPPGHSFQGRYPAGLPLLWHKVLKMRKTGPPQSQLSSARQADHQLQADSVPYRRKPPSPPPPQRPKKPAPAPATPASPVQPAKTSAEAPAIPSAPHPAEPKDLAQPAPAAHPAPPAAPRPPGAENPLLDCEMTTRNNFQPLPRLPRSAPDAPSWRNTLTGFSPSPSSNPPSKAEQKPVRHGLQAQPCAELSAKEDMQRKISNFSNKNQNYANLPAGGQLANPAAPTDFDTASFFEAAAQANRSWADLAEDNNPEPGDNFITVQRRKRRRGSADSPAAAAPSSNTGGARINRRPRSSTGSAPRAEEIRTTRAHIAEPRARQASSTEDHCVYVERSPELEPYHYMRAIDRMFEGTREVFQMTKMNGHFLVGLANRGLAERLVNKGLEVEGTLHRAFPFRKRAERITVGNLPFFVGDAAVISALTPFGRVTSIAPKLMKAGPYIYSDGRREAFIILHEGMTIERLPTRLDISIKGEAWPAYLSSAIRCSRCRGQGHRRANCPLLAGRTNDPGPATPTSPTSVTSNCAWVPQQPSAQPLPTASPSPTMEVSDVPPASRAALHPPPALRPSPPAPSALPVEEASPAPPPVTPTPSSRAPEDPASPRSAATSHLVPTPPDWPDHVPRVALCPFWRPAGMQPKHQIQHANFAAACVANVTSSTSGVLAAATNWAEQMEASESGEEGFTIVRSKRRRRESSGRPVEQRSSGIATSGRTGATPRRRPPAGRATVVQEIRATRADIADARARQRSSTEDNCVFVEHCSDFGSTHYLQAVEELVRGAGNVLQVMKMDGHMLVGLSTKALAERLIKDGLEIGHTHLRAFPFKKRAERITVGNLPFFVDDAAVIEALRPYGDVTSIVPIRLSAGKYTFTDGRHEAFILLKEAYGVGGRGPGAAHLQQRPRQWSLWRHLRLPRTLALRPLSLPEQCLRPSLPPSPLLVLCLHRGPLCRPPRHLQGERRDDLEAFLKRNPGVSFAGTDGLGLGWEEVLDPLSSKTKAQRHGPPLTPPQSDALSGLIDQLLDQRPGGSSNINKILRQVKTELKTGSAAVTPTPPLPAPRCSEPTPPAPHGEETTPAVTTPPPPLPAQTTREDDLEFKCVAQMNDLLEKLNWQQAFKCLIKKGLEEDNVPFAIVWPEDRETLLAFLSPRPGHKVILAEKLGHARDYHPMIQKGLYHCVPLPAIQTLQKYILSGVFAFIQDKDLEKALEPYGQMISSRPLPFPTDNPHLKHLSSLRREIVFKNKEKTPLPAVLNIPYMDRNFTIFIGEDVVCNGCKRHGHLKIKCPFDPTIRATVTRTFSEALRPSASPDLPSETPKEARDLTQRPSETTPMKRSLTTSSEEENFQKERNDFGKKPRPDPQSGLTATPPHDGMEKEVGSVLDIGLSDEKILNVDLHLAGLPGPSSENQTTTLPDSNIYGVRENRLRNLFKKLNHETILEPIMEWIEEPLCRLPMVNRLNLLINNGFAVRGNTIYPTPLFNPPKKYILSGILASLPDKEVTKALAPFGEILSVRPLPFPTENPLFKHLSSLRREVVLKRKESTDMPAIIPIVYMQRTLKIFVGEYITCLGCRRHGHIKSKCPFNPEIRNNISRTYSEAINPTALPVIPGPSRETVAMNITAKNENYEDETSSICSIRSMDSTQLQKELMECEEGENPETEKIIATIYKKAGISRAAKVQQQLVLHPDLETKISCYLEKQEDFKSKNYNDLKSDQRRALNVKIGKMRQILNVLGEIQRDANPPAGVRHVNLAAARDVTLSLPAGTSSNGAARVPGNWADCLEDLGPGADDNFTVVKIRRGAANRRIRLRPLHHPPTADARRIRRMQSSARSVPRAQVILTTRAHIAEARARQASSAEEHCVYLEHGPELQPFHYLRALDRLLGGTAGVVQVSKGFPFRKRAERVMVGNLPFFVENSAIISALGPYGRITYIAPKMMKAGPYTYTDGLREAFIVLHERVTTERLPTRLDITIKGEAWPAYASTGIKCSRCHGQEHRRAKCPLLVGRANNTGLAPPTSPAGVPPPTTPAPPQRSAAQPPAPAPSGTTMEPSGASPAARTVIPSTAPRPSPPVAPGVPMEKAPTAPPPVTPTQSLRAPGSHVPAALTPDFEMSNIEETSASSTSSTTKSTRDGLIAFIERNPGVSFARTDALGLGREEVLDLLSSKTKAKKQGPLLSPTQGDPLAGLIGQLLALRPGGSSNIYKVLRQVKTELRTALAAVPPTPTLPAHRPAEPTPPAPKDMDSTPAMATPPPPPSTHVEDTLYGKFKEELDLEPMSHSGIYHLDLVDATLDLKDRVNFVPRLLPMEKNNLAQQHGALLERALDLDPSLCNMHVNLAAARDVTAPKTVASTSENSANPASPNWADSEMAEVEANDDFILVRRTKKRRLGSTSPEHAARQPNRPGEQRSSQQRRWPTGPRTVPPREIKATRVNIAEAKTRQSTSNQENYIFVELCPDIPDYSYLLAMSKLVGGPKGITQFNRMNSHYIVGLATKDLARRLVEGGLEIEGTTLRVFPYRKRAERIIVANLPGFVEDSAVVNALSPYGKVTSIAPFLAKMGEFTFTDGRREAFILLNDGIKLDRLPTRLDVKSKGDSVPAFLSFGIKCSKCGKQGYRRANCPALARQNSSPRQAASPTDARPLAPPPPPPQRPRKPAPAPATLASPVQPAKTSTEAPAIPSAPHPAEPKDLAKPAPAAHPAPLAAPPPPGGRYHQRARARHSEEEPCPVSSPQTTSSGHRVWPGDKRISSGKPPRPLPRLQGCSPSPSRCHPGIRIRLRLRPGVAVLQQRILWPGHIALATIDVHGEEMTAITVHLAHEPRERNQQLELLAATEAQVEEGACWIIGDFNIRHRGPLIIIIVGCPRRSTGPGRAGRRGHPVRRRPPALQSRQARRPSRIQPPGPDPHGRPSPAASPSSDEQERRTHWWGPRSSTTCMDTFHHPRPSPSCRPDWRGSSGGQTTRRGFPPTSWRGRSPWLVGGDSGEAWVHPPPDGIRLQPRRLRLLKLWEEASNILGLNHRALPTAQLLDLLIIGGCRFLSSLDLLAFARWRGARVRDLIVEEHLIARPTRSALADAAALGAFCRTLTSENAAGFGAESTSSSSSLAAAVVLQGTATPFLNGLTTRSARRALDRPRLAATPISRFTSRWSPTIDPPPSRARRDAAARRIRLQRLHHPPISEVPGLIADRNHRRDGRRAPRKLEPPELTSWAIDRMVEGAAGVIQITKVNGHQLLGLANRGLAERLISEGLEVEGTLLKAFPFRKRAERITVGNLPFFVGDSVIINVLSPYWRATSIAPKQMKAGPYVYVDGRRDVFIALHEGITIERLPIRLDINIKGEAWSAYLTSGIRCSRCHGQGYRRANCPLLAGRTTNTRLAPPASPAGVRPSTTPAPPQLSSAQSPAPAPPNPAMEISGASPAARAALPSAAPRPSPPAPPASSMEVATSAPPPVAPAPSLQASESPVVPRPATLQHPEPTPPARPDFVAPHGPLPTQETLGPATPTPDVEMSIVEETSASSRSSTRNSTRDELVAFIKRSPGVFFTGKDGLGLGREEVLDLLSSRTRAQRHAPMLTPPQSDALAGLINQLLDLRLGGNSNIYKILRQVKSELKTIPATVPPTPPLPAHQPAEPTPPTSHGEELMPAIVTPPPPLPAHIDDNLLSDSWRILDEVSKELSAKSGLGP
ncbi:hypothetical protein LAZ67_10001263, partial [Cordylochernes scorpioides]